MAINYVSRNMISNILNSRVTKQKETKNSQSTVLKNISNVSVNQALERFKQAPTQDSRAIELFDEMCLSSLPDDIRNIKVSWEGELAVKLLGMIYKDIQPEDQKDVKEIIKCLVEANGIANKESKAAVPLNTLMLKYGDAAMSKVRDDFIDCCREAWRNLHSGHDENTTDDDIFERGIGCERSLIDISIKDTIGENKSWVAITHNAAAFDSRVTSASKVLKYHATEDTPAKTKLVDPDLIPRLEPKSQKVDPSSTPYVQTSPGPEAIIPDSPTITLPAGNGHGPITINNHIVGAQGGNATIGDINGKNTSHSDIDFGIKLLETSNDDLGGKKVDLINKFIALHWARQANGGKDSISDHLETIVPGQSINITETTPNATRFVERVLTQDSAMTNQNRVGIDELLPLGDSHSLPLDPHFASNDPINTSARRMSFNQLSQSEDVVDAATISFADGSNALKDKLFNEERETTEALSSLLSDIEPHIPALRTDLANDAQIQKQSFFNESTAPLSALQLDSINHQASAEGALNNILPEKNAKSVFITATNGAIQQDILSGIKLKPVSQKTNSNFKQLKDIGENASFSEKLAFFEKKFSTVGSLPDARNTDIQASKNVQTKIDLLSNSMSFPSALIEDVSPETGTDSFSTRKIASDYDSGTQNVSQRDLNTVQQSNIQLKSALEKQAVEKNIQQSSEDIQESFRTKKAFFENLINNNKQIIDSDVLTTNQQQLKTSTGMNRREGSKHSYETQPVYTTVRTINNFNMRGISTQKSNEAHSNQSEILSQEPGQFDDI